ncbi:MAG TPA: CidA/LrgA family protein [Candidatus Competibacteraceae bacterium]|nr:CidA/LrgA family protein [Candidatus Competibacteraceae bacterium]MCP5132606.1 CidA/LrgA family protein [Gammaproteobacteria bacterium]HPF57623.1 CidA/LrgA family protein [Candidatus Competibacteraceae bacterium]
MTGALTILLLFQLIGEVTVQLIGLPVPGPVVGMVLLFLSLRWRKALPDTLRATAETLLSHLSLLFIPAGAGVIQYGTLLADEWLALIAAMVLGTLITVAVTALVMQGVILIQHRMRQDG